MKFDVVLIWDALCRNALHLNSLCVSAWAKQMVVVHLINSMSAISSFEFIAWRGLYIWVFDILLRYRILIWFCIVYIACVCYVSHKLGPPCLPLHFNIWNVYVSQPMQKCMPIQKRIWHQLYLVFQSASLRESMRWPLWDIKLVTFQASTHTLLKGIEKYLMTWLKFLSTIDGCIVVKLFKMSSVTFYIQIWKLRCIPVCESEL